MDINIYHQPHMCGSGMWYVMHTQGVVAITPAMKAAYESNTNALCDSFRCKTCQPHFRLFIDTHDIKKYFNMYDAQGRDIGCFYWSWLLHNSVNARLGKYQPTFEEAYAFYSNFGASTCSTCGRDVAAVAATAATTATAVSGTGELTKSARPPGFISPGTLPAMTSTGILPGVSPTAVPSTTTFGSMRTEVPTGAVPTVMRYVGTGPQTYTNATPSIMPVSTVASLPNTTIDGSRVKPIVMSTDKSSVGSRITPTSRPIVRPGVKGYRVV